MNQQQQIQLLAAALEEVGKMPEWIAPLGSGGRNKPCLAIFEGGTAETVMREEAVLAALAGVAYSHCLRKGFTFRFNNTSTKYPWRFTAPPTAGEYSHPKCATEAEALAAAVKIAGKGEKQ